MMTSRAIGPIAATLILLLSAGQAQAEHRKLHEAVVELEKAKKYLRVEKKHEQVVTAHRAVREAIKDVKQSHLTYGGRRERLIKRLDHLDKELESNWKSARKALDEAIEDLEFAEKH